MPTKYHEAKRQLEAQGGEPSFVEFYDFVLNHIIGATGLNLKEVSIPVASENVQFVSMVSEYLNGLGHSSMFDPSLSRLHVSWKT